MKKRILFIVAEYEYEESKFKNKLRELNIIKAEIMSCNRETFTDDIKSVYQALCNYFNIPIHLKILLIYLLLGLG